MAHQITSILLDTEPRFHLKDKSLSIKARSKFVMAYTICACNQHTSEWMVSWSSSKEGAHTLLWALMSRGTYRYSHRGELSRTAMADNNSISGSWVLDLSRSDTMEGYLRCMRIPEPAIQHQILQERSIESRNVIALDRRALVIVKRTWVHNFAETLVLGEERAEGEGVGARRSTATLGESGQLDGYLVTSALTTSGGDMVVVEARQLMDNGISHIQEINIMNLITGMQHVTRRLWVRVPTTDDDREFLSAEQAF